MPGVLTPAAAARIELTLTALELVLVEDSSEFTEETELISSAYNQGMFWKRPESGTEVASRRRHLVMSRLCLLEQLEDGLLSLVGLLERSHTGGLQDVELGHVGNGLADVGVLDAVGSG